MGSLTLRFAPEDKWHGELFATVASDGFAGVGSTWFNHIDLLAFADRLSEYPLGTSPPPSISGGYLAHGTQEAETHLSLVLTPHDPLGGVRVLVELAKYNFQSGPRIPESRVRTAFVVTYTDIERFQRSIHRMMKGDLEEALLTRQTAEVDTF
jgi:hypothetical protein